MSIPQTNTRPQISLIFEGLPTEDRIDMGNLFNKFQFQGMVNGGYSIRGTIVDSNFNILGKLIDNGYFKEARTKPIIIRFQIRSGTKPDAKLPTQASGSTNPVSATKEQIAILISMKANGEAADEGEIEFIGIDPPSWYLNVGDGNGGVYKGSVSNTIQQVVEEYAPKIKLDISRTVDSKEGKWWMMRQDPKTFLSSLFDWSSAVTKNKTQWIFAPDGYNLVIKEQADLQSRQRAFYRYQSGQDSDTIRNWELLADNALSTAQSMLITQGISATSGQYIDRITDTNRDKAYVNDDRTSNKRIARIKDDQGFTKPPPNPKPQNAGWSSVSAIPEIYSAGDLGVDYNQYIDGRPRAMWLNMTNALMRVKLECLGHGEWSSCEGLGIDTVFLKWTSAKKSSGTYKPYWWMTGNWLVYGFNHRVRRGAWYTDLYLARFDHDSSAVKVGF